MNTIVQFPDGTQYDFKSIVEFIHNDYGSPDALPKLFDDAVKQITLSGEEHGPETPTLLFGMRDAFKKVNVIK